MHPLFCFLLGQTTLPASQPATLDAAVDYSMMALTVLAIAAMLRQRLWRPTAVLGPARVQRTQEILVLAVIMFAGACVWMGLPVFYFAIVMAMHPGAHLNLESLSANQLALLTSVPYTIAIGVLIVGDWMPQRNLPSALGYAPRKIPAGLLKGLLAFFIVMPLMYWTVIGMQWIYQQIGYEHPPEVEMMRAMNQPGLSRIVLIFGASVLAPIFEELLFRGHLQTILRGGMLALAEKFFLPPITPPSTPACPLERAGLPTPLPRSLQIAATWLAILITSLLFARLHETWSAPMIFVLAVCLGYVYERTGNLWACITIHALFNISETALYFGGSAR